MKRIRSALGILIAVLMLFGCMPLALAKGAAKDPAERDLPEVEKIERIADRTYAEMKLSNAAAPENASDVVQLDRVGDISWLDGHNNSIHQDVAYAEIVYGSGTYSAVMQATRDVDFSKRPYVSFRAYYEGSGSLTVTAVNNDTGYSKVLVSSSGVSGWKWYSGVYYESGAAGEGSLTFTFTFTYTDCDFDSNNRPYCMLTDLRIGNASNIGEAARAASFGFDFEFEGGDDYSIYTVMDYGQNGPYVVMNVNEDEQSQEDPYIELRATVSGNYGDRLSFDYAAILDYMDGADFTFGVIEDGDHTVLFQCDENGGGQFWDDEYDAVESWENVEYYLPATGTYTFYWHLWAVSDDSLLAIDNVLLSSPMTFSRVLCGGADDPMVTFAGAKDWTVYAANGMICAKSGDIVDYETSSMITRDYYMDADDEISFYYMVSSESNYDWFNAYCVNAVTGDETQLVHVSGQSSDWVNCSYNVPARGAYYLRFDYVKDLSVSRNDDCAYVRTLYVEEIGLDAVLGEGLEEVSNTYYQGYFTFTPTMLDGEMVLGSNNQGVNNNTAGLKIMDTVAAGKTISFDYKISADPNDEFYVEVYDSSNEYTIPLDTFYQDDAWHTFSYHCMSTDQYRVYLHYYKNSSVCGGEDTVWIKNYRITDAPDLDGALNPDNGSSTQHFTHCLDASTMFEPTTIDGYNVAYLGSSGTAAFMAERLIVEGEYIRFNYVMTGVGSSITLLIDGVAVDQIENEEYYDAGTHYYRVSESGEHTVRWTASSVNGIIYIDEVYFGLLPLDLEEAVNSPDTEKEIDEIYSDGFFGVYDPLNTGTIKKYAISRVGDGETAVITWEVEGLPGDEFRPCFAFLDADGEPNGSSFILYINGVQEWEIFDDEMLLNRWYMLAYGFNATETVEFTIEYVSQGEEGVDGFKVGNFLFTELGHTLDEALNVEGGTLHFSEPNGEGTLIPYYEDDVLCARPNFKYSESAFNIEYEFENTADLGYWTLVNSDGDNHNFQRIALSGTDLGANSFSSYAVCSYSKYPGEGVLSPDDWMISIPISVDWGSNAQVSFLYAKLGSGEAEDLAVYVLTGNTIDTAELLYQTTVTESGWQNIGISLYKYMGRTVRIAFRHTARSNCANGLVLDQICLYGYNAYYSLVTFEAEVNAGDEISYSALGKSYADEVTEHCYLIVYEDGEVVSLISTYELLNTDDWVDRTFYANSSGTHIYTFLIYFAEPSTYQQASILLDNIAVHSTVTRTVRFISNLTGQIIEEQQVLIGGSAQFPTPPTYTGYTFTGWSVDDLSNITEDMVVYAYYSINVHTFKVHYQYEDGTEAAPDYIIRLEYGSIATLPLPTISGYTPDWEDYSFYMPDYDVTITVTYYPDAPALTGDVDCDGDIDFDDVTLLNAYLLNAAQLSAQGLANANVNGDNKISSADVVALNKLILGSN